MRDEIVFAMNQALNLARESASAGEVPVGAVVLDGSGNIIGKGANMREQSADPLAHAEVLAMKDAATSRKSWNLSDCTLVVTLEPCPMCAGAVLQTRLKRVIFGGVGCQTWCVWFCMGYFARSSCWLTSGSHWFSMRI